MDVTLLVLTASACLGVGLLIGWTGVAGFLLPMFFAACWTLEISQVLAICFLCFAVSGVIGSLNYKRAGNLPLRPALYLSAGSLLGALLGAMLNQYIPAETVKLLLYAVVLLSGSSILLRKEKKDAPAAMPVPRFFPLAALGLVTGLICALSGAGGPVLVMPLLVVLGFPAHAAVGVALFDSIFIALPAVGVYWMQGAPPLGVLALCAAAHAVGVLVGSGTARYVPGPLLKKVVGVCSVAIALYMLLLR